jgi:hypothetical protein
MLTHFYLFNAKDTVNNKTISMLSYTVYKYMTVAKFLLFLIMKKYTMLLKRILAF